MNLPWILAQAASTPPPAPDSFAKVWGAPIATVGAAVIAVILTARASEKRLRAEQAERRLTLKMEELRTWYGRFGGACFLSIMSIREGFETRFVERLVEVDDTKPEDRAKTTQMFLEEHPKRRTRAVRRGLQASDRLATAFSRLMLIEVNQLRSTAVEEIYRLLRSYDWPDVMKISTLPEFIAADKKVKEDMKQFRGVVEKFLKTIGDSLDSTHVQALKKAVDGKHLSEVVPREGPKPKT
jgi:hypothetical protein